MQNNIVVAIPVRDEEERIGDCLDALDNQAGAQVDHIVLLLNNCTDRTAEVARAAVMRPGTQLHVVERTLPPHQSNAGHARRLAMQQALRLAGPEGVLLTSDADSRVDADWLAATLAALAQGVDAVAGWVELEAAEWGQIPWTLHEDDARECAYDLLCDEIHALLDPDPADPWPRHTQASGASLAVTAAAYLDAGGMPDIPSGEDRAFLAALRRIDARIRHAPGVHVTVSGRMEGRAPGGMADTIRRRLVAPDRYLDDRLEPAADCARRAAARRAVAKAHAAAQPKLAPLSRQLDLPEAMLAWVLRQRFGVAWQVIEDISPVLVRRRVAVSDVAAEITTAQAIVARLRLDGRAGRSGILAAGTENQVDSRRRR